MAETSSLLNCRTGNRTTSSNLVASAVRVAKTYDGAIAQLVEQRTENPCVPGSIPGGTTKKKKRGIATQQRVIPLFSFPPQSAYDFILLFAASLMSGGRLPCIVDLLPLIYLYLCGNDKGT